ncbi:uncharacterized protein [Porites lutea]|uniref:uncharacterized protein isoform X2 n=1 Tax=Porites lutea TaxID=51062 RepID=UPI003CC52DE8
MDIKEKTPNEPQGGEIQSALNPLSAAPPAYTPGDTARSGYTAQPGYTVQQPGYPPKQQPYLAQPGYPLQTFSTVSMQVDSSYDEGDYQRALSRSNAAKLLNIFSIICGLIFIAVIAIARMKAKTTSDTYDPYN